MRRIENSLDQKIALLFKLAESVRKDAPSFAMVRASIAALEAGSVTTDYTDMRKTG